MDYNRLPPLHGSIAPIIHHNKNNVGYPVPFYYPGLAKPQPSSSKQQRTGAPAPPPGGHTVPGPGPGGSSQGSRSFAAALRNLAKQAGPPNDGEGEARQGSPKTRPPPPPLVRGPSPSTIKPTVDKERPVNSEQRSGFQPYRPEEPRVPPAAGVPPGFPVDYPTPYHHPHPHPASLYPPHIQHAYRLEEQMYLERCGMPMFSSYPPTLYGLMPSPLSLITPVMHERYKLEEERLRQREQEKEREKERDREHREKNKKSPRASPSYSNQEHSARKAPIVHPPPTPQFVRPFEDNFPSTKLIKKTSPPTVYQPNEVYTPMITQKLLPTHQLVETQLPIYPPLTANQKIVENNVPFVSPKSAVKPPEHFPMPPKETIIQNHTVNVTHDMMRLRLNKNDKQLVNNNKSKNFVLDISNFLPSKAQKEQDLDTPVLNVPDPKKVSTCVPSGSMLWDRKNSVNVISRLDVAEKKGYSPAIFDDEEDLSPQLILTKGPPDKLDAPPRKLRFLAMFGLTTLAKRNDLELRKLGRRRAVPSVELVENTVINEEEQDIPLSLPLPQRSPRSLHHSSEKLSFLTTLKLQSLNRNQRQERESIWQEVLAERRRRKRVTPLVSYCSQQRVYSPENIAMCWPGIEDIIEAYHTYHSECSLEVQVLRSEYKRLEEILNQQRQEAKVLEEKLEDLNSLSELLHKERNTLQHSLDSLMTVVRKITSHGHSND
uniref:Genetic suppressor element-like domain-containing protein n=1 Tax=Clastoptera arizonana TaxID=38151 RepID=A0A1B6DSM4_9HEMI